MLTEKEIASHKKFMTSHKVKCWLKTMLTGEYERVINDFAAGIVKALRNPKINADKFLLNLPISPGRLILYYNTSFRQFVLIEKTGEGIKNIIVHSAYPQNLDAAVESLCSIFG